MVRVCSVEGCELYRGREARVRNWSSGASCETDKNPFSAEPDRGEQRPDPVLTQLRLFCNDSPMRRAGVSRWSSWV